MANKSKESLSARFTTVAAGVKKNITGKVTIDGTAYTAVTLAAVFTAAANAIAAADSQHTQWLDSVDAMKKAVALANAVYKALKQFAIGQYGANQTILTGLGITLPKSGAERTAATKAVAAIKANATKEARGTTGKKQRKSVKGNVQVTITATPTPTPPPATEPAATPVVTPAAASNGAANGTAAK